MCYDRLPELECLKDTPENRWGVLFKIAFKSLSDCRFDYREEVIRFRECWRTQTQKRVKFL